MPNLRVSLVFMIERSLSSYLYDSLMSYFPIDRRCYRILDSTVYWPSYIAWITGYIGRTLSNPSNFIPSPALMPFHSRNDPFEPLHRRIQQATRQNSDLILHYDHISRDLTIWLWQVFTMWL